LKLPPPAGTMRELEGCATPPASSWTLPAAVEAPVQSLLAYHAKSTVPVGTPCAPLTVAESWTTEPMGELVIALCAASWIVVTALGTSLVASSGSQAASAAL
jgi:hypothetical protein